MMVVFCLGVGFCDVSVCVKLCVLFLVRFMLYVGWCSDWCVWMLILVGLVLWNVCGWFECG